MTDRQTDRQTDKTTDFQLVDSIPSARRDRVKRFIDGETGKTRKTRETHGGTQGDRETG